MEQPVGTTCQKILLTGKNKGNICGKKCSINSHMCSRHQESKFENPCQKILLTGKNKGNICGNKSFNGTSFCSKHQDCVFRENIQFQKKITVSEIYKLFGSIGRDAYLSKEVKDFLEKESDKYNTIQEMEPLITRMYQNAKQNKRITLRLDDIPIDKNTDDDFLDDVIAEKSEENVIDPIPNLSPVFNPYSPSYGIIEKVDSKDPPNIPKMDEYYPKEVVPEPQRKFKKKSFKKPLIEIK